MTATAEKKKAPTERQLVVGATPNPLKGTEMNAILSPAPESIEINELLKDIDNVPQGYYYSLDPGHELYREPLDVWVRPASEFDEPTEYARLIGTNAQVAFGDFYDLAGRKIPTSERPESWWAEQTNATPVTSAFYEPNSAQRLGNDYIMIGRGKYEIGGETTLNGERAFEFISLKASVRRAEADRKRLLPLAQRFLPEWAAEAEINGHDDAEIEVIFCTENFISSECRWDATATVEQYIVLDHDGNIIRSEAPAPSVFIAEPDLKSGWMSQTDMRAIAEGLNRLSSEVDRIFKIVS